MKALKLSILCFFSISIITFIAGTYGYIHWRIIGDQKTNPYMYFMFGLIGLVWTVVSVVSYVDCKKRTNNFKL
jgi:uncharacterized membrane protein